MTAPLTVASFYVHRPDHPKAGEIDFAGMLRVLQTSCDRLGVRHVVLSDFSTMRADIAAQLDGMGIFRCNLPDELMQATTQAHSRFLATHPGMPGDVLFVGCDAILLRDPRRFMPDDADMAFTYRPGHLKYPINNGFMFIRERAREAGARFFRAVADRCGPTWGDDQKAVADLLAPLPAAWGEIERYGAKVRLLPMRRFNDVPAGANDKCKGVALLHFRGRKHKGKFFPWAKAQGFM